MSQFFRRSSACRTASTRIAGTCALLLLPALAQAQLVQFTVPGDMYRAGKISAFSPAGSAITGYLVSDGLGGNPTPRAFTYTTSGHLLLDTDAFTIGLAVSDDGRSAVRATASLGGIGFLPNGSKVGSMSDPAGSTLLPFRSLASSADGQHLVGRDPSLTSNGGFARRTASGAVMGMPTLENLPEPRNLSVSRDGLTVAADFSTNAQSNPTPAIWTAEFGIQLLPAPTTPNVVFATVRQLSGDGYTVVGNCVTADTAAPGNYVTKGGFWTINAGASAEFVQVPGFSSMALVNDNGSTMFGYGENYDENSNAEMLLWTAEHGTMPFAQYLSMANVQLPAMWASYTIDAMSGDGLSFSGFATSNDGLTDVAFIVTIPSPTTAVIVVAATAIAAKRRRRR